MICASWSDPYLRFSSKMFDLEDLDDRLVHLCNFSVQKDGGQVHATLDLPSGGDGEGAAGVEPDIRENMLSARSFAAWANGEPALNRIC